MKNYSQRHINRALDMILDDLANAGDLGNENPGPLPVPLPGPNNATDGPGIAPEGPEVADDACGDAYLSEANRYGY